MSNPWLGVRIVVRHPMRGMQVVLTGIPVAVVGRRAMCMKRWREYREHAAFQN